MLLGMVGAPDSSDLEYMEGLYREFYPLMVSAAHKYTVDPQDRDDVIQNALVCLVRKSALLRSLDRPVLASYIYRTVQHIAIDLRREREKTGQWESPLEETEWFSGEELRPAENAILSRSRLLALRGALARLSPTVLGIDTEDAKVETIQLNGQTATLAQKEEEIHAVYVTEDPAYFIRIYSIHVPLEDFLRAAENLT